MIFNIKKLSAQERKICLKTISPKAVFAIVGDAIKNKKSISVIRMGDGERGILKTDKSKQFNLLGKRQKIWDKRLGIGGMPIKDLQKNIINSGNKCTYFAPSISGISFSGYNLYNFFKSRPYYFDNFFVNDWTKEMIKMLLESSGGVFIVHRDYKKIIDNFNKNYNFQNKNLFFGGFPKNNWQDNQQAINEAIKSKAQLILFSAGPAGKIIGPEIAKARNKIVLDVGNTLIPWSKKRK